jgi:hypothetical protein
MGSTIDSNAPIPVITLYRRSSLQLLLLDQGIDAEIIDAGKRYRPLQDPALYDAVECAKMLVDHGARLAKFDGLWSSATLGESTLPRQSLGDNGDCKWPPASGHVLSAFETAASANQSEMMRLMMPLRRIVHYVSL